MINHTKQVLFIGLILLLNSCGIPAQNNTKNFEKTLCVENLDAFKVLKDSVIIIKPLMKSCCCIRIDDDKLEKKLRQKMELSWEKLDINMSVGDRYPYKYTQKGNILHVEFYYITLNERLYTTRILKLDNNKIFLDFEHLVKIKEVSNQKDQFFKMSCDVIVPNDKIKYEIWFKD